MSNAPTETDPRWAAVVARDPAADGTFVYSVATTGVYCRPSCRSRAANPRNVRFHAGPAAAERAGFRACLRCTPDVGSPAQAQANRIATACRRIAEAEEPLALKALAQDVGLSPHHFHRLFKSATGLTPAAYGRAVRAQRVRRSLTPGETVTTALYDAGFNSSSRFYAAADAVLGMTPTAWKNGGAGERIVFGIGESRLGAVLAAQSARGVCAVFLGDDPEALVRDLQARFPRAELAPGDAAFDARMAQVVGVVQGELPAADLPLDVRGTAFQQRVWEALRDIPAGATATYAEVAARIGAPGAVRAVGTACGANPVAVAIPCHRVVRRGGGLSGYRWGIARKQALLEREGALSAGQPPPEPRGDGRGRLRRWRRGGVDRVGAVAPFLRLTQQARAIPLVGDEAGEPLGLLGPGAADVGGGHGRDLYAPDVNHA